MAATELLEYWNGFILVKCVVVRIGLINYFICLNVVFFILRHLQFVEL